MELRVWTAWQTAATSLFLVEGAREDDFLGEGEGEGEEEGEGEGEGEGAIEGKLAGIWGQNHTEGGLGDGGGTLRGATSGLAPPPPQILTHLTSV